MRSVGLEIAVSSRRANVALGWTAAIMKHSAKCYLPGLPFSMVAPPHVSIESNSPATAAADAIWNGKRMLIDISPPPISDITPPARHMTAVVTPMNQPWSSWMTLIGEPDRSVALGYFTANFGAE